MANLTNQQNAVASSRQVDFSFSFPFQLCMGSRLRQVDVKAEHYERQVAGLELEVASWEKKYEEAEHRYRTSKAELEEVVAQMESL